MGNVPLMVVLGSFVVTFLVTRLVTRLIRSGRGPFSDNVTGSGIHVHHAVPGIFLLVAGAVVNTASVAVLIRCVGAVGVGSGASLVLDEFALILRLEDVYWREEGRASVQVVAVAAACLLLSCLGFALVTDRMFHEQPAVVFFEAVLLAAGLAAAVVCEQGQVLDGVVVGLRHAGGVHWGGQARSARVGVVHQALCVSARQGSPCPRQGGPVRCSLGPTSDQGVRRDRWGSHTTA